MCQNVVDNRQEKRCHEIYISIEAITCRVFFWTLDVFGHLFFLCEVSILDHQSLSPLRKSKHAAKTDDSEAESARETN